MPEDIEQISLDTSESTSDEESTLEQGADDEVALSAEDAPDATEDEANQAADDGESPAKGRSQKLQRLIDSKGGDEEKFADGIFETFNSLSRMRKELDDLKSQVTSRIDVEEEEVPIEHPDLSDYKELASSLDAQINSNRSRRDELILEARELDIKIARLEGKAELADNIERPNLLQELSNLKADRRAVEREYYDVKDRLNKDAVERKTLDKRIKAAEREIEAYRENKRAERQSEESFKKEQRKIFFDAIEEQFKIYGISDEETRDYMANTIRAEAYTFLVREDGPAIDFREFVAARAKVFAKIHKIGKAKEFTAASRDKLKMAGVGKAPVLGEKSQRAVAEPAKLPKGQWTADFARERARKIAGMLGNMR